MECKNPGCGNKQRIMPINGKGSFEGFDVFQCPSCKTVATTVRKSVSRRPINEVWPEGKPMRTAGKGAIPDAKHPRIKKGKDPLKNPSVIAEQDKISRRQRIGEQVKASQDAEVESGLNKLRQRRASNMNKSLSNKISKFIANKVEKGLWNQQTACTDDKCGWKQPYDKNDSEKALLHSAINNCPKCKKPAIKKPFSPDF
jgi:hypothetical protein